MEAGVDAGGVFVHCFGGRSRSAAFIIAFLMSSCGWSYDHVYNIIKSVRPVASINTGFEAQLRAYSLTNCNVYAAQQVLLRSRLRSLNRYRLSNFEIAETKILFSSRNNSINNNNNSKLIDDRNSSEYQGHEAGHKRSWGNRKENDIDSSVEEEDDEVLDIKQRQLCDIEDSKKEMNHPSESKNIDRDNSNDINYNNNSSKLSSESQSVNFPIPTIDPKTPNCRLSRPGSHSVRVIPPLRGLDRGFCCSWCGVALFCLANVIRVDLNILPLLDPATLFPSELADHKNGPDYEIINCEEIPLMNDKIFTPMGPPTPKNNLNNVFDNKIEIDNSNINKKKNVEIFGHDYEDTMDGVYAVPKVIPNISSIPLSCRPKPAGFKAFDFGNNNDEISNNNEKITTNKFSLNNINEIDMNINEENNDIHDFLSLSSPKVFKPNPNSSIKIPNLNEYKGLSLNNNSYNNYSSSISSNNSNNTLNKSFIDYSPRIPIPPNRTNDSLANMWSTNSPKDRPQSVEKRRWLARVSLLQGNGDSKIAKLVEDDDDASHLALGSDKYLYLEYLDWMGTEIFQKNIDSGDLHCYSCNRIVGSYNWLPGPR